MCYFDAASENPVGGANGRLIYIPSSVGVPALESLIGMGVNIRSDLSGHNTRFKIGVIEKAYTSDALEDGSIPVHVEGYFYAKDFADELEDIRAEKDDLGFSYEAGAALEDDLSASVPTAIATSVAFTGASVLYKKKAAYTRTSLAAEGDDMNKEQLMAMLAEMGVKVEDLAAMSVSDMTEMVSFFKEFRKSIEAAGGYASLSMYLSAAADEKAKVETMDAKITELTEKLDAASAKVAELETSLTAANEKIAQVEPLVAHAETLKANAEGIEAYSRKSVVPPATLSARYAYDEKTELKAQLEAIENDPMLDLAGRMAAKMRVIAGAPK